MASTDGETIQGGSLFKGGHYRFKKGFDQRHHGLRTANEGINQRYLKNWADVADKICCRHA